MIIIIIIIYGERKKKKKTKANYTFGNIAERPRNDIISAGGRGKQSIFIFI